MARAHKYLLMPQRDLTVGGRAPVTHLLRPARLPAPRYGSDHLRGQRGLLLPGLQRDAPVAGYNYSSDWTPLLTGLSPARMAASLAAPPLSSSGPCPTSSLPASRRTSSPPAPASQFPLCGNQLEVLPLLLPGRGSAELRAIGVTRDCP